MVDSRGYSGRRSGGRLSGRRQPGIELAVIPDLDQPNPSKKIRNLWGPRLDPLSIPAPCPRYFCKRTDFLSAMANGHSGGIRIDLDALGRGMRYNRRRAKTFDQEDWRLRLDLIIEE